MTQPTTMIERISRAICAVEGLHPDAAVYLYSATPVNWESYSTYATAALRTLLEPSEEMWDGLTRQLIMWMDMQPKTPRALFAHLGRCGHEVPDWLREEPEMKSLDHVPSKGTRAVIVFRSMISTALGEGDPA